MVRTQILLDDHQHVDRGSVVTVFAEEVFEMIP